MIRRIAVYLAGFLGGLLVYTVLKVGRIAAACNRLQTSASQMTILPEMQPDDMSFYQDNDKLGAGMMFLCVLARGRQMWLADPHQPPGLETLGYSSSGVQTRYGRYPVVASMPAVRVHSCARQRLSTSLAIQWTWTCLQLLCACRPRFWATSHSMSSGRR